MLGRGSVVGDAIVGHGDLDAVSVTGSPAAGQRLAGQLAGRQAKMQRETGGKNPLIVVDDADHDEAAAIANDTDFGLSSGIVTTSLRRAADFKRQSIAGTVMVNRPTAGSISTCRSAAFYTTVKTAYTAA